MPRVRLRAIFGDEQERHVFLIERANGLSTATASSWSPSHLVVWRKRVEVPFDCTLG